MGELYKLTFQNGKSYIGIAASSARGRYRGHRSDSATINRLLYYAWRKYGAPILTVLATIENDLLRETEIKAIAIYGTFYPEGYNLTKGGDGSFGVVPSPEKRAKISASLKGKVYTPEYIAIRSARISAAKIGKPLALSVESRRNRIALLTGRVCSSETRAKIGAANRNPTLEARAKMSAARKGAKFSPETRAKLSKANKGKVLSTETRAKIAEAVRGRKHSPESRAKISATRKRLYGSRQS